MDCSTTYNTAAAIASCIQTKVNLQTQAENLQKPSLMQLFLQLLGEHSPILVPLLAMVILMSVVTTIAVLKVVEQHRYNKAQAAAAKAASTDQV